MTPTERAKELRDLYFKYFKRNLYTNASLDHVKIIADNCALIHCREVINLLSGWPEPRDITIQNELDYYKQVKEEINLL